MYMSNTVRASKQGTPMFPVRVLFDCNKVIDFVFIGYSFLVLILVVLSNETSLSIGNVFPIGLEAYVEHGVATENKLGRRSTQGGVHSGAHAESDSS